MNELFPSAAWRLLLPDVAPASVAALGSGPAATTARQVFGDAWAESEPVELVVGDEISAQAMREAFDRLAPGGVAYLQAPWPRLRGASGLRRIARRAGFGSVRAYSLSVGADRWRASWWVPLGDPAVARYVAEQARLEVGRGFGLRAVGHRVAIEAATRGAWLTARNPAVLFPRSEREVAIVGRRPVEGMRPLAVGSLLGGLPVSPAPAAEWPIGEGVCSPRVGFDAATAGRTLARTEAVERAVALRVGGSSTDQPMLFAFDGGCSEPSLVVKVPDRPEERAATAHEHRVLVALQSGPLAVASVPQPVAGPASCGAVVRAQTGLPGRPMTAAVTPATFGLLAAVVTDWLIALAKATIAPTLDRDRELVGEAVTALDTAGIGAATFGPGLSRWAAGVLGSGGSAVSVRCHCDLGPWNIHVDRTGRIGVLDWAESIAAGPPGGDLLHFLTHLALSAFDAYELPQRSSVVALLRDQDTEIGAVVQGCVDRYYAALSLPAPPPVQLRVLAWTLAAGRQDRSARRRSIYHALLVDERTAGRALVDHASPGP